MKTFLSMGAGPGMSFATAERFARGGFCIVFAARSAEKTRALAERLQDRDIEAFSEAVDAGDPAGVALLVSIVERRLGSIDVLHYNAASMRQATIESQAASTFNSDLAINVGGALVSVQSVLHGMTPRGEGDVFLTGGGFALYPSPDYLSLSVGKAGLRTLALGLFETLKAKGIHISTVTVAGSIETGSRNAELVAEEFWKLHAQPRAEWSPEVTFTPDS